MNFPYRLRRLGRINRSDLRQVKPEDVSSRPVNWYVSDHLWTLDIKHPGILDAMTPEQATVYAIEYLRREVGADGFEGYFGWSQGLWTAPVLQNAHLFATELAVILRAAMEARDLDLEKAGELNPAYNALDLRVYEVEATEPIDERLDAYIADNEAAFFIRTQKRLRRRR